MRWPKSILTDSGGFQVFSLRDTIALDDEGVTFASVYDGSKIRFTPESVARAQASLGSDIAMVLDECPPGDANREAVAQAVERTTTWAARARAEHLVVRRGPNDDTGWSLTGQPQLQFGIVQGGTDTELRERSTKELLNIGFEGYAIGGLSVGEAPELTMPALESATSLLPVERPRYFMGIGDPVGILDVIDRGIDMFDCVLPTRLGRTAAAMVPVDVAKSGRLNLRNAIHTSSNDVLDPNCTCPACAGGYTRSYLRHLFQQQEILGLRMVTLHNLHVLINMVSRAREAIVAGTWASMYEEERAKWAPRRATSMA
jgi:queuine tRNA-ribosyltransferase